MVRRLVLAGVLVAVSAAAALANGRPPASSTINFRRGHDQDVLAGMTFGNVISHDGGETWHWMCEKAVIYGGNWDPDYAYAESGAIYATTFDGSLVMRDGCSFVPTQLGNEFVSSLTIGPDNAVFLATAHVATPANNDPGDAKIYRSGDDGVTFTATADPGPGQVGDWWNSIEVAPSDGARVYLTGYRLVSGDREFLLFRSSDGGAAFTPMGTAGLTLTKDSDVFVVGISATDPDEVYLRITYQTVGVVSDAIYRSTDGGQTWTQIRSDNDSFAFLVEANGHLLVAGANVGLFESSDKGMTWSQVAGAPHINCLVQNDADEIWACTQNFGPEGAGIMKTSDLATWTKVLVYDEIDGPVDCPAGTLQYEECVAAATGAACGTQWCCLRSQFGIAADPTDCPVAPIVDGVPDGVIVKPPRDGCCQAGGPGAGASLLAVGIGALLLRRRRRREP
jgi:hypothetical protein